MVDTERKKRYSPTRVLISGDRVKDSQFLDTTIRLTGGQLELLRNLTQYLHRRSTFVAEYENAYYLIPTDDDWDTISAIVASLEEKLMGDENALFGYYDRYFEQVLKTVTIAGWNFLFTVAPPAGEIYVVNSAAAINVETNPTSMQFGIDIGGLRFYTYRVALPGANTYVPWSATQILKEDDRGVVAVEGCDIGDHLLYHVWGYKMKVPE